jgi:hypothetical protein
VQLVDWNVVKVLQQLHSFLLLHIFVSRRKVLMLVGQI